MKLTIYNFNGESYFLVQEIFDNLTSKNMWTRTHMNTLINSWRSKVSGRCFVYSPVSLIIRDNRHSTFSESLYLHFLSLGGREDFALISPQSSIVLSISFGHLGKFTVTAHYFTDFFNLCFAPNTKLVKAFNRIGNSKIRKHFDKKTQILNDRNCRRDQLS